MEEWLTDSNEALTLHLGKLEVIRWSSVWNLTVVLKVRAEQDPPLAESSFNPEFTYPIFGDKEKIFGYKGLDIQVRCPALLCKIHLTYLISYPSHPAA